jgi:hypothetical protein
MGHDLLSWPIAPNDRLGWESSPLAGGKLMSALAHSGPGAVHHPRGWDGRAGELRSRATFRAGRRRPPGTR